MKSKQTVIIIGGGVAGLIAARRLAKRDRVIILEARDRFGGRIHTAALPGFSGPVEMGAEFIHGKLPLTLKLLRKAGIKHHKVDGKFYRVDEHGFREQEEMIKGWNELLKRMKKEKNDMTLEKFLQKNYSNGKAQDFKQQVRNFAEGFDLADTSRASMKALYREWSSDDPEFYRVEGGYSRLVNFLVDECKSRGAEMITDSTVTSIKWEKSKVIATTFKGDPYHGEKCIVSVPLRFLQNEDGSSIKIDPMPANYQSAINDIGFSSVIKIAIEFKEPFWKTFAEEIGFIISDEPIPTWWTQLPGSLPLLTGWKGGPGAISLSKHNDEEILKIALASLGAIFKMPVADIQEKIVASKVFNWFAEPFSRGAYSYAFPGSKSARNILNLPIDNTIFFAGEAFCTKVQGGTVEAALINGRQAASRVRIGGGLK